MSIPNSSLDALARRLGYGDDSGPRDREATEASLVPIVRRVLRTGSGIPHLVQWVRRTLPQVEVGRDRLGRPDPESAAPPLARLLYATLRRAHRARPALAADTVIGV